LALHAEIGFRSKLPVGCGKTSRRFIATSLLPPHAQRLRFAVTGENIAELAATAFIALLIALLSVRTIGHRGKQCGGGESVSQFPLKRKAFLTFLGQNQSFELQLKAGVLPPIFPRPFNFRRRWTAGLVGVCPPVTRCASFFYFTAGYARRDRNSSPVSFERVSRKPWPSVDFLAADWSVGSSIVSYKRSDWRSQCWSVQS
jgi:hypothetical protein